MLSPRIEHKMWKKKIFKDLIKENFLAIEIVSDVLIELAHTTWFRNNWLKTMNKETHLSKAIEE